MQAKDGASRSPITVTFLGTSAGMPTAARGMPAVALVRPPELLLFDCGEGTQMQARRAGVRLHRVTQVCISHLHGDHVLGLPGLLMSLQMGGRTAPLSLHGPPGLAEFIHATLRRLATQVAFPLEIHEQSGEACWAPGAGYHLECAPLEHRILALGYALVEEPTPGALDAARARRLGVPPGPLLGRLKAGEAVSLPSGRVVRPEEVCAPARRGRRIAYCSDTRPCAAAVALAAGADLLIHEATFAAERARDAQEKSHSTTVEAAAVARAAGARRLVLTHLSPRYEDAGPLAAEARAVFPETVVAEDLLALTVPPAA